MKRFLIIVCALVLLCSCRAASNRFSSSVFDADLPETFRQVSDADILCFAPYGDPLRSSSITFYSTELNWYFDTWTESEYASALGELCGYDALSVNGLQSCRVDGYDARRIACKVLLDQSEHDLIIYAIHADHTYFFTLLNRESDSYIEPFDAMMKTINLKGMQS